jgi:phosphoglucomutase
MTGGARPRPGQPADASMLVDVSKLVAAYYDDRPDPSVPAERVSFGTSGHRGSSFHRSFNEAHILAITQAIVEYRRSQGIDGPLFIGRDTHALSAPAFESALEVLAANRVEVRTAGHEVFTPTPAVSLAILTYNRGRTTGGADGIVVTPSHNPPEDGGFKYNPPHGGPADETVTAAIQARANALLEAGLAGVARVPVEKALAAATTRHYDFLDAYVSELAQVVDFDVIRAAGLRIGVDPLGGAGVRYWAPIADRYRLDLTVVSDVVDPTFGFMTVDWDGRIRMDPSSPDAMQRLIQMKDRFDIAVACDTDHDRHGVVAPSVGLMPPNHYLCASIDYLFRHRPGWRADAAIGKTLVSSSVIDRVGAGLGRRVFEVPVGFKWFVDGLLDGSLGFVGEESAGAAFLRRDGTVWTTDKDGLTAALLAAEMTARTGQDPGDRYRTITQATGDPVYARIDAPATSAEKKVLATLSEADITGRELAGEPIRQVLTAAPGNGRPIGGVKVVAESGWFAARPSGTEDVYKIYAESFRGAAHLEAIQREARELVAGAIARRGGGAAASGRA